MNPRVKEVVALAGHRLRLKFANGEVGVYDCTPLLTFGVFRELADVQYFGKAAVEYGTVVWPNSQDICPDTLYLDSKRNMEDYPKIQKVEVRPGKQLLVRFRNGVTKLYDCGKILQSPAFAPLRDNDALFGQVRADPHGYAVIWNDELDLAESEVWLGGKVVREESVAYGSKTGKKPTEEGSPKLANTSRIRSPKKTPNVKKATGRKPS